MAHRDREKVALMRELREEFPAEQHATRGVGHVFRTGDSELYAELDPSDLRQGAAEDRQVEMLEAIAVRSLMIVPMSTGGRRLGTIAFALSEAQRHYDRADLSVAEELGRRAAVAIDNARLYRERSHIARTLQESLLPPELPEVAGAEVAARFHPAGEATEVGGDFYDVFDTSHGWSVVMGDVCGKGADAAALTALARYTLRTLGVQETSPAEVLRKLNERPAASAERPPVLHRRVRLAPSERRRRCRGMPVERRPSAPLRAPRGRHGRGGRRAWHAARGPPGGAAQRHLGPARDRAT